ncbi:hypothetical protein [Aurantiacibacter sediminis]|uniref:P/Homo B domain-containing protein n=1 Tax=Aurantiacibacter sediminis TaxID=2793064 RepID=A0ABS0MZK3_9SPHN|nr:hypothetical protein [Aurantiacibacter sediminis]MBH5321141.1 hypothetical protein [Aurantiacibacter sediminis]
MALDGVAAIPFGADTCNLDLGPTEDEMSVHCSHHMQSFDQAAEEFARLHSYFQACLPRPLELSDEGNTRGGPQVWSADSWFEAEDGEITGGWRVQIEHYDLSGTPRPNQRVTLEITRH